MKTTRNLLTLTLTIGFLLLCQLSNAQKLTQKATAITVSGTSPMHDWIMTGSNAAFTGVLTNRTITNVIFTVPAKSLKAEKGKMMERKAYDALIADKAPNITFTTSSINIGKSNVTGKLTIAGVTKNVSFPVSVTKKGSAYIIDCTETVKLSEFGMERPGFMGIKTGDIITIKVNVTAE